MFEIIPQRWITHEACIQVQVKQAFKLAQAGAFNAGRFSIPSLWHDGELIPKLLLRHENNRPITNTLKCFEILLSMTLSYASNCINYLIWSCHAATVNTELNNACRVITGTLKPTPLSSLYRLASIAPPSIRRRVASMTERTKQLSDPRHPLHGHVEVPTRLRSRNSFTTVPSIGNTRAPRRRLECWSESDPIPLKDSLPTPSETLPKGCHLKRKDRVTLNRARAYVGRTNDNLCRWGLAVDPSCPGLVNYLNYSI